METMYTLDIARDNEVIFTKEKEANQAFEELTITIAESFNLSHVDAEAYAKKLTGMALGEYSRAFRGGRNGK